MEDLWRMWLVPRAIAQAILGTILLTLFRLPFARAPIVPGFIEYQPGFALLPFLGAGWGAAGCWAAFTSSLLTDTWMDLTPSLRWPRAIGMFLAARCGQRLLAGHNMQATPRNMAMQFVRTIPSACLAALCVGAAAGAANYFPYTYISTLSLVQHLFFLALLSPLLMGALERSAQPREGLWRIPQPALPDGDTSHTARILLWGGAVGGWIAALFVSGHIDGIWPRSIWILGTVPSGWAHRVALLFLLPAAAGCFWPLLPRTRTLSTAPPHHP